MPTPYVIAGPNGVGKTTSSYSIVPKDIPIINSDEIAKEVRKNQLAHVNVQELSNEKAIRLMEEQRNQKNSFAIETNLSDVDTWKFLIEMKKTGYDLHVIYMSTSNLSMLNNRINERVKQGDHFVKPDVVEERYIAGLNLLNHYFDKPDKLQLFDNSDISFLILEVTLGKITYKAQMLPEWVTQDLSQHLKEQVIQKTKISELDNIEQVRQSYKDIRQTKEHVITPDIQKQNPGNIESQKNKSQEKVHKKNKRQKPKH